MPPRVLNATGLKPYLKTCRYRAAQLLLDYRFDRGAIPLAAFADTPFDTRSACINVIEGEGDSESRVAAARNTGAPVVFACCGNRLECWKQTTAKPVRMETVKTSDLDGFFGRHKADFAPGRIYEAKTRSRLPGQAQLRFVDIGLMPMVERNMGDDLSRLVQRVIRGIEDSLAKRAKRQKDLDDVFKSAFWLVAAKILRDKQVDNFKTIKLTDIDDVFRRVGRHYGDTNGLPPGGRRWRAAIEEAAGTIDEFSSLNNISTEALAYLYENALVPDEVRKALGVHSTPSSVVDYMVWQLWPWIEQIPEDNRHVFEPACGHAAFLVGAMRLLRQWSSTASGKQRHDYLKRHLRGVEIDSFALEIAKLSLTLADIPHGNSWDLKKADMFDGDLLERGARRCRILLANPPYEKFSAAERSEYGKRGTPVSAQTKAVAMLKRTIPYLPRGSVFGVIVPQGTLHSAEAADVRELLVCDFEIAEIGLFADNLFEYSDQETAVILGRRRKPYTTRSLTYRRVREKGMEAFRERFAFSFEQTVPQATFACLPDRDMRLRELNELWGYCTRYPSLKHTTRVSKGFDFKSQDLPEDAVTWQNRRAPGLQRGFKNVPPDLNIWALPRPVWMNLDDSVIGARRSGTAVGISQILLNYAPASREPWRIKAVLDVKGHAVTSRFLTVRPEEGDLPLEFLWAVLNSPLANAFAYCWSDKRQTLVGTWRKLPLPTAPARQIRAIVEAANAYLDLVRETEGFMQVGPTDVSIKRALLRMDAEILRLYDLPPRLERQLLDLFQGVERKGVGCDFRGYYPEGLDAYVPLHELISEEYQRSTLDVFLRRHKPTGSPEVLAALRGAAEAYAEE